ncbi:MAG: Crp/Fnr family transcriptional regulator [Azospirillaceae bacterium]
MAQAAPGLDRIALLAGLSEEARATLTRACAWRRFDAHEVIIDRADEGRDVFFVVEGRVRIVNYSAGGREISFDDLDAGTFFGELSAIDGEPRSAAVIALTPVRVAVMPGTAFLRVATHEPEVGEAVLRHLAAMVRRSTERIMDLSTLAANNRVHAEVLRLARAGIARDGRTAVIRPIPIHGDIAARVSTARETVARVFGELSREGLVIRRADHLEVTDFAALEAMVETVRGEI